MLVHKATMGILDRIWTGDYHKDSSGRVLPVERSCTLQDVDDPNNWWEVASNSSLGKRIRMYYPDIIPETDPEGNLINITLPEISRADDSEAKEKAAISRGYNRRRKNLRPCNLMPFLKWQH